MKTILAVALILLGGCSGASTIPQPAATPHFSTTCQGTCPTAPAQ